MLSVVGILCVVGCAPSRAGAGRARRGCMRRSRARGADRPTHRRCRGCRRRWRRRWRSDAALNHFECSRPTLQHRSVGQPTKRQVAISHVGRPSGRQPGQPGSIGRPPDLEDQSGSDIRICRWLHLRVRRWWPLLRARAWRIGRLGKRLQQYRHLNLHTRFRGECPPAGTACCCGPSPKTAGKHVRISRKFLRLRLIGSPRR